MGGCDAAVREAVGQLAAQGIEADFMRVRGFPFGEDVEAFLEEHSTNFIVEQNRDAQLRALLLLETRIAKDRLVSVLAYSGFPLSPLHVVEPILRKVGN